MSGYKSTNIVAKDCVLTSPLEGCSNWKPWEVEGGSIYATLTRKVRQQTRDWTWLTDLDTGRTMRAREGLALADAMAGALMGAGVIGEGQVAHLLTGGNDILMFPTCLAVWKAGGVASLGKVGDGEMMAQQISDSRARAVLCCPEAAEAALRATEASAKDGLSPEVLSLGPSEHCRDLLEMADRARTEACSTPSNGEREAAASNPKATTAAIFWTSGTTGRPKGILHSHNSCLNYGGHFETVFEKNSKTFLGTKFCHAGGFRTLVYSLMKSMEVSFTSATRDPSPERMGELIQKANPRQVFLPSHLFIQLAKVVEDGENVANFDSVVVVVPAGAAVPTESMSQVRSAMKNVKEIARIYGQTEMGLVAANIIDCGGGKNDLGTVLPGCAVKVVDPDTGKVLGKGETGEILGKSNGMMLGYLNGENNSNYFDEEGYGRSGDLGYFDGEGRLLYVDRLKDVIKHSNNHVSPSEIEAVLNGHPSVSDSAVFGVPHPEVMEVVCAVAAVNGEDVTGEELKDYVNSRVSEDFKKVRGGVHIWEYIPRNPTGKILRREIRERFLQGVKNK